jgi:dolichyl-phosphate-mannose--protein O-mannosyl transferase
MMAKAIKIDDMSKEIMKSLHEYAELTDSEMKKAVRKTASAVRKEISENAPKETGDYAKSWTTSVTEENSHALQITIHAKKPEYRLAHLLENGHALRRGGRSIGKGNVDAIPHIAPAEEHSEKLLEEFFRKAMS